MAEAYDDLLDYLKEQDAPSTPQTSGAQPSAPKPPTFTEDSVSQASDQDLEAALSGYSPAPPSKKGIVNDVLVGLGKGAMEIPSAVTGLADIPAGLVGLDRPFDKVTDAIGEATGLQPKKWAEAAEQDYSPAMQRASRKINEAWQDPNTGALDVAKAYAQNPRGIMKTVVESLPSMFAGNAIGGKLVGLGKNATALTAEQLAKKAALGAGVGEGAVMAGQAMENIDKSVDPQAAAAAALATGVGGGLIGMKSGEIATKLGLGDINQIIASGGRTGFARTAEGAVPATGVEAIKQGAAALAKRVGAGALQEGPIEEGTQSALETAMQNLAEGKPIGEGMARNVVEGSLAGAAMGGGANVYAPKTAEQPPQDAATRTKAFVDATTERFRRNKVDINRMSMSESLKQAAQENGIDIQGKAPVEIFNALRDLAYPPAPPAPKDPNIEEAERLEATGGAVAKAAAANLRSGASSVTPQPTTLNEEENDSIDNSTLYGPRTPEGSVSKPDLAESAGTGVPETQTPAGTDGLGNSLPPPDATVATGPLSEKSDDLADNVVAEEESSVIELEQVPAPEVDPYSDEELDKRSKEDLQRTIWSIKGLNLPKDEVDAKINALRAALDRKKQNPRVKEQVEKPESTILNSSPKTEEKQETVSTTPEALSGIASEDNSKTPEPKQTLFKVNGADVDYNALTDEQKQAWDEAEANYRSTLDLAAFQHKMEPNTVLKVKTEKAAGLRLAAERRRITGNLTAKERRNAEIEASRVRPGSKLILEDGRTATAVNSPAYGKVKVAFEDGSVGNVPFAEVRVDTNPVEETNEEKRTGKESTGTGSRVDPVAGAAVLGDAGAGFAASDADSGTTEPDANAGEGTAIPGGDNPNAGQTGSPTTGVVNGKSQNPTPQEAEEPAQEQVTPKAAIKDRLYAPHFVGPLVADIDKEIGKLTKHSQELRAKVYKKNTGILDYDSGYRTTIGAVNDKRRNRILQKNAEGVEALNRFKAVLQNKSEQFAELIGRAENSNSGPEGLTNFENAVKIMALRDPALSKYAKRIVAHLQQDSLPQEQVAPTVSITQAAETQNAILDQTPEADKQNGDYPKTRFKYQDLDIALENGAGSVRSGTDESGRQWSQVMHDNYGEIPFVRDPATGKPVKTEGADKDHVDVFIKPDLKPEDTAKLDKVFIVDQVNPKTGAYDEHKAILGYKTVAEARKAYNANYEPGWKGGAAVTGMPMAQFKEWLLNGDTKAAVNPKAVEAYQKKHFGNVSKEATIIAPSAERAEDVNLSPEEKIRQAVDSLPSVTIGSWHPITVEHNGVRQNFLANIKKVSTNGKDKSAIHLISIREGRILKGEKPQPLAYYYKLDKNNALKEEGVPGVPTPLTATKWKNSFENQAENQKELGAETSVQKQEIGTGAADTGLEQPAVQAKAVEAPDTTDLFKRLDSRASKATRKKAQAEIPNHPLAERIQFVEDNFLDLLSDLEQSGKVKIKC